MRSIKTMISAAVIFAIASAISMAAASTIMTNIPKALATTQIYVATLSGDKEVPPVTTQATGTAGFSQPHLNNMSYGIKVSNIGNVTRAHIHQGKVGQNGPVIVTLFKADNATGTGPVEGQLVGGTISNDKLEGPLAGKSVEVDLVKVIENGEAYVNVHTTENPDGAIRGQIGSSRAQ